MSSSTNQSTSQQENTSTETQIHKELNMETSSEVQSPETQGPGSGDNVEDSDSTLSSARSMNGFTVMILYFEEISPVYNTLLFNNLPRCAKKLIFKDAMSHAIHVFSYIASLVDLPAVVMSLPLEAKVDGNVFHVLCRNMMWQLNQSGGMYLRGYWEQELHYVSKVNEKFGVHEIVSLEFEELEIPDAGPAEIIEVDDEYPPSRPWVIASLKKWPECFDYTRSRRMHLRVPWRIEQHPDNTAFKQAWNFEDEDGLFDMSGLVTLYVDGIDMLLVGSHLMRGVTLSQDGMEVDENVDEEVDKDAMSIVESLDGAADSDARSDGSGNSDASASSYESCKSTSLTAFWPGPLVED